MKKRSKLDLSPGVEQDKPQAAGFGPVTPPDPAPEPQYAERQASTGVHQPRPWVAVKDKRSSRALIVKTVALVAIAALSLYLLKRRLL